ncbi:MAG: OmpH family outer membrane protein [bacterium]
MRVLFRAASAALVLVAGMSGRAAAQQKFAFIKSSVLLEQAPGRAAAESLFSKESVPVQEQMKRMSDSLQAMVAAFEKRAPTLTAALRDAQGKEIQAKEAGYQARARDLEAKQNQRQNELLSPILDRLKLAIEDVRVEGGYSFIFNADGQGSPIVALDKNLDLTERVLAKLRAGSTAAAPAKPATGAPTPAPSGVTRPVTPPLD